MEMRGCSCQNRLFEHQTIRVLGKQMMGEIMDSILDSVKKSLGIMPEYTHFDQDIILCINTALMILNQLGVGNELIIEDSSATWNDFLSDNTRFEMVKTYVYLRTRMTFDPPSSSVMMDALKEQIKEYEWRLNVNAESLF